MDMKDFFKSGKWFGWCMTAAFLAVTGLMVFYGEKESSLRERFYRELVREQAAAGENTGEAGDSMGVSDAADGGREDGRTGKEGEQEEKTAETGGGSERAAEVSGGYQVPGQVKVLLMDEGFQSYEHRSVKVQGNVPLQVTGDVQMEVPAGEPLEISALLDEGQSARITVEQEEGRISLLSLERSQGIPAYQGTLTVINRGGSFLIRNQVDLETYLKYVVPSEMPAEYPQEALRAQAVCARTYAVRQMQERRLTGYGADVDDSVSFQVYNNIGRQEAADEAVDSTRGVIMTYQGQPIQAYFFSTSCGHTSTDEVWGAESASPYLRSVEVARQAVEPEALETAAVGGGLSQEKDFRDFISQIQEEDFEKEDVWYRWQVTLPLSWLQEAADRTCPEIGGLTALSVLERSGGGAVTKLEITGNAGSHILDDEYAIREFLSPGDIPVRCNDGSESTSMEILPSAYFFCDPVYEGETLTGYSFQGGGYGHGVGMSQNGAKALAQAGKSWEEILEVFYQNIQFSCD